MSGRPIDLVDLDVVGEPLLGVILAKGLRLVGEADVVAGLLTPHLRERADFQPCRRRILDARRARWTGT